MSVDADGKFAGKRLVIFGCGYVGAAVATGALERGMRVTALTRNPTNAHLLREQGIDAVVADLATPHWHDQIEGGPEFVLNCVSASSADLDGYRHSYVRGMESVLEWARGRGPIGTLVYTSSTSVYPQGNGVVVDENAVTSGAGERGELLLEAEDRLRAERAACGRWFILRIAGIYGPGRHYLLDNVRAGEIAELGDHHLNLAHRHDISAAIWACFGAPGTVANEIFNVADDEPARKVDVVAWLAARLAQPVPRVVAVRHERRRPVSRDRIISNKRLKSVLGWKPEYPSFRDGYEILLSQ